MLKKVSELKNWDKNPRSIKKDDFERLKNQIKRLGVYKPLLINKDNVVLGGNMRLKAYKDMGIEEVEVNIVDAQTEAKMVEYALSDNDRAGYWEEVDLANLIKDLSSDIDLGEYKVDLGSTIDLNKLLEIFEGDIDDPLNEWAGMPDFNQGDLKGFKQIVVTFPSEEDMNNFSNLIGQKITRKTRSIWYPPQPTESRVDKVFVDSEK